MSTDRDMRYVRHWTVFFMVALTLSGLTAIPLEQGTRWLAQLTSNWSGPWNEWAQRVADAVSDVGARYPFLLYGTDWLAFAHVVLALAFIGVLRDPVRNIWVVQWGLLMCALSVLFAFAWAPLRGIPFFWRCVDASFGLLGMVPLLAVHQRIRRMEKPAPS